MENNGSWAFSSVEIKIIQLGSIVSQKNTKKTLSIQESSPEWRNRIVQYLTRSIDERILKEQVLYIWGSTHTNKNKISDFLIKGDGFDLICLKKYKRDTLIQKIFFFIPSPLYFIIKVTSPTVIQNILLDFDAPSVHEIYLFDNAHEQSLLNENIISKCSNLDIETIQQDSSHLIIGIDTDSLDTQNGFTKIVSYGKNVPKSLVWFL